ncbi:carboxypeptidase-like regulatory domain-containing protein [Flavobacteriaceae bacterium S0825]|uniref:carboxypeptidase-like regulatory domain-containing protein n=1 Tax=Gaetbulibacter sp. S0825 TaxID=2720084 RepID=UPI00142F6540|nr:carboxypeptidase-like regulatory domain-containing protein [Gaetbulibacter sp. S0825]MCK0108962.1 carboxypeptidase-like regulatory domain-containing protein [Flavobacteriaceae bacterium S0825]NIX64597.1 TonB-dependent receptor plug domain-containing protein [Gaetbulibacter sp. S0825]
MFFIVTSSNADNLFQESDSFQSIALSNDLEAQIREKIFGSIINAETSEVIPYCNIEVEGAQVGTSSNELGEFVLEVDSLPVTIVFSHLNYEKKVVELTNTSNLTIQLTPLVNSLNEVVISTKRKSNYPYELALEAFSKTRKLTDKSSYGQAFYRQKSKNDDEYTEFSEIIYDTEYTVDGINDWEISEGRYALKREKINNSNFTLLSRILKAIQPDTDDIIFPLSYDVKEYYDVKIVDILSSGDEDIAVLKFRPLPEVKTPAFEGEAYINTKTYEILKISGTVINDRLDFIKFREKKTYTKNYTLSYEMAFKKDIKNNLLIDYIKVDHSFDYYRNDSLLTHVSSTSNLTYFEYYDTDSPRRFRKNFRNSKSDWETLNKIGYNEKFWENNPIVKRTPVEDEVIASFEKANAFESIFLNTKEQIAFMQSNLRGDVFIKNFDTILRNYNNYNPIEKVFLHTDKEIFFAGEMIWYNATVVLGPFHHLSTGSMQIHVDLIDEYNSIVASKNHKLIEGKGEGNIIIPGDLPEGKYQLRAYTNWMQNFDNDFFFTKTIQLLSTNKNNESQLNIDNKIDLQFFPEGGHAVNGLNGKVAFKAIGSNGYSKEVKGIIKNSKGEIVVPINTIYQGMGFFTLNPQPNETYTAVLEDGSMYKLPETQNEGYSMLIDNLDTNNIKIKVQASNALRSKPFYIIGTINNEKYYQGKFAFNAQSVLDFEIPKNKFPSGVMTITLFDEQMRPWVERPVFVNNNEELIIQAELEDASFERREKVKLKVNVKDVYGTPLSTNFSIAITDAESVNKNNFGTNILTHLLLESNIKGHIENPGYFFSDTKRSTRAKLDLVMSTHGWRKFNWQEMDKTSIVSPKEFLFKKGYSVSGIATNMQDVPLKNRELKMIAKSKSDELMDLYVTKTDEEGNFIIENVTNAGDVDLTFNAYQSDGNPIQTKVALLDSDDKSNLPKPNFKSKYRGVQGDILDNYNKKRPAFFMYDGAEKLDEVLVTAEKKSISELTKYSESLYGAKPDHTIINEDKTAGNILYHLGNIPGVAVDLSFNWVNFRGNQYGPLWIVDGMRLDGEIDPRFGRVERDEVEDSKTKRLYNDKPKTDNVPLMVQNLDFSNVERIEILKRGSQTAVYGPVGRYGVIIVYTKSGRPKTDKVFSSKQTIKGYSKLKEFYSPKYDVVLEEHKNPDNRTTLYWNPSVKTDKNGNAAIIFYNSDSAKSFEVDIQALSQYGTPGVYLNTFKN